MIEHRIKVQTQVNGTVVYIPQYRSFLFWKSYIVEYGLDRHEEKKFTNIENCKQFIDHAIVDNKYIKYP